MVYCSLKREDIAIYLRESINLKKNTEKYKDFIHKYSHAWIFLYGIIYLTWFNWLERTVTSDFSLIYSPIDSYIPFIEFFIVPYLLWFVYVAATCFYFFFTDKRDFYRFTITSIVGMTLFLIICTIFPNGLRLRPMYFQRDNIFVDLVRMIYALDTPTNVLPSLHVYNSLACHFAIAHSEKLAKDKWIVRGSLVLCISIILSTMFLKQHSVIDVASAFIMFYFVYTAVYAPLRQKHPTFARQSI